MYVAMAYVVMACVAMAYVVMAYVVMAYVAMAHVVMASRFVNMGEQWTIEVALMKKIDHDNVIKMHGLVDTGIIGIII